MTLQRTFAEKKFKILLIDDDGDSRSILRKELQMAHCDVITAENGKEGLCLAATIDPDLILLNVNGPKPDGFTVFQQLKNDAATCTTPVIFLTGEHEVQEIIAGIGLQGVDYVVKPYTLNELRARILKAVLLWDEQEKQLHPLTSKGRKMKKA